MSRLPAAIATACIAGRRATSRRRDDCQVLARRRRRLRGLDHRSCRVDAPDETACRRGRRDGPGVRPGGRDARHAGRSESSNARCATIEVTPTCAPSSERLRRSSSSGRSSLLPSRWRFAGGAGRSSPLPRLFIATRQHAILVLYHDGVHCLVARSRRVNDFIVNSVVGVPLLLPIHLYRALHLSHHRHLGAACDPERVLLYRGQPWTFRPLAARRAGASARR